MVGERERGAGLKMIECEELEGMIALTAEEGEPRERFESLSNTLCWLIDDEAEKGRGAG